MWTKKDAARILALAAVFLAAGLLLFPPVARPAPRHDAELVAWYLKGEADVVFGSRGWTVSILACKPAAGRTVTCRMRLNNIGAASLCSHGRFRLDRFRVAGLMSAPTRCQEGPPA